MQLQTGPFASKCFRRGLTEVVTIRQHCMPLESICVLLNTFFSQAALCSAHNTFTGVLISPQPDQEGNKLQRQKILIFIYPIIYHNWRNISTIYVYNKTSIKRNILTIKQNTWKSRSCYGLVSTPVYVLRGSENKQRSFLYTALTDWFL